MNRTLLSLLATFLCTPFLAGPSMSQPPRPICQHPDNPSYFLWRGKAMALVTSGEHYGAVINLDFDFLRYLDALQQDGLNYTRIFAGSYVEPQGAFNIQRNTLAPAAGRFLAPFERSDVPGYAGGGTKFDLEKISAAYLDRLRAFVRAAGERGIVVEVTLFSSTYSDKNWAVHPFNPANNVQQVEIPQWELLNTVECPQAFPYQARYVRGVVEALSEFDKVFFEIQNEPWSDNHRMGEALHPYWTDRPRFPNAVEITLPRSVAWQTRIAEVIREAEASLEHPHLIAQNISNFRLAVHEDDIAPTVDLFNFHYAFPEAVRWNQGHGKIVGFDESGFAGREDATYLRQAWRFMMSGGGLFNNLDYSFTVGHEDGSDVENEAPGGGSPALRRRLGVLSRFLHSFDLAMLVPAPDLVAHAPGASCIALSAGEDAHAAYLEGRGNSRISLRLANGNWRAEWINTFAGDTIEVQHFECRDGLATTSVPDFEDCVAVRLARE